MAISSGKSGTIFQGVNEIACIENFTVTEDAPIFEVTCLKDTNASQEVGIPTWRVEGTLVWDPADTTGQGAVLIGASLDLDMFMVDEVTGSPLWEGTAIVSSLGTAVTSTEFTKQSFTMAGTGTLTKGTV